MAPAAHRAGRQRRVHRARPVHRGGVPARALERIHFAVQRRAALLDPPVVTAAEDAPLEHQHRADRDAAFRASALRLFDRCCEKHVHVKAERPCHSTSTDGTRRPAECAGRWRHAFGYVLAEAIDHASDGSVFLVVGLVAALLGFTTIAGASIAIAKFCRAFPRAVPRVRDHRTDRRPQSDRLTSAPLELQWGSRNSRPSIEQPFVFRLFPDRLLRPPSSGSPSSSSCASRARARPP